MNKPLIDRDLFRKYRKDYAYSYCGCLTPSFRYGWLPQTDCKSKVISKHKFSVDFRYNKKPAEGDQIPFFYFCVYTVDGKNQPVIKFMLDPRAFFGLVLLANYVKQNSANGLCALCLAHQAQEPWNIFTHRGSVFYLTHRPRTSVLEPYRKQVPHKTQPILVYSEPIHKTIFTKNGNRHKECYLMRIYYTPRQKDGSITRYPWQIRLEKLAQKDDRYVSAYRDFNCTLKSQVSLSTEDFYDIVLAMWNRFVGWLERSTYGLLPCPEEP